MLNQIISMLLSVLGGLLTGACLLRWWMQHQRVSFNNPLGQLVMALTSWLVLPLRKLTKSLPGGDWAGVLGAWLVQLAQALLLWLAFGGVAPVVSVLVVASIGVVSIALSTVVVVLLLYAVTSWLSTGNAVIQAVLYQLSDPLLRPLRKYIPLVGGVDLTPLVLLLLLQVAAIVLASLQSKLLALV